LPTARVPPLLSVTAPTVPLPESVPLTITAPAVPFTFRWAPVLTVEVLEEIEPPLATINVPPETVVLPL
jgi:hypothetical protein